MRRTLLRCNLALLGLLCATQVFAQDPVTPPQHSWPWWHEAHGHPLWWLFPLMFFVMMIVMFIFMTRRGGMGCMWRDWMMDSREIRGETRRNRGEPSESALDILDKRYARGEIEKQEYEEKKAAINSPK